MANLYSVGIAQSSLSPQIIETIWASLEIQVTPANTMMSIGTDVWTCLDHVAKNILKIRAAHLTGLGDMMFVRDGTHNSRWLLASENKILEIPGATLVDDGAKLPPIFLINMPSDKKAARAGKIPRPPNAYILYRKDHHQLVKDAHPGIHNNEISVILGSLWKCETQEVRDAYVDLAAKIRARFHEQYPDYRYNPRRSRDVKRRAKRNAKKQLPVEPAAENNLPVNVGDVGPELSASFSQDTAASHMGVGSTVIDDTSLGHIQIPEAILASTDSSPDIGVMMQVDGIILIDDGGFMADNMPEDW